MQQPLAFARPESSWSLPDLNALPSWKGAKRVAIDVETRDEQLSEMGPGTRRGGYVCGIGFAIEDGPSYYLPVRHETGTNLDPDKVWSYLRDQAKEYHEEIVGAQLGYEYDYLAHNGVHFRPKYWRDVQVAMPLLDEHMPSMKLDRIAERYGMEGKREKLLRDAAWAHGLKDVKKILWRLDPIYVADYCIGDCELPLKILRRQEKQITSESLWTAWDLESDVLPILAEVRRRGLRVDMDEVDMIDQAAAFHEAMDSNLFSGLTDRLIPPENLDNAGAVADALMNIGIKLELTDKGEWQVDAAMMFKYQDVVAVRLLHRAKAWHRLRSFVARTRKHAICHGPGHWRVHPTFNQLRATDENAKGGKGKNKGTYTGRMSSDNPNNQQEPTRNDEFGDWWRSIYIPDDPTVEEWISMDFSQQEPRGMVHYAEKLGLKGARDFADRYRKDPKTDFHNITSEISGIVRKIAKNLGLGIGYGMGGGKMCREYLNLPTQMLVNKHSGQMYEGAGPEGQAVLDKFFAALPWLKQLPYRIKDKVNERGYLILKDADGRRLRFQPRSDGAGYLGDYKATNRLIQGHAAVQTKIALVALAREGLIPQNVVHDEVNFSNPKKDRARARHLAEVMRDAHLLNVPNRVKVTIGPSWGEGDEMDIEEIPLAA